MVNKKSSPLKTKSKKDPSPDPSDAVHGEGEKLKSKSKRIVDLKMMLKKARSIKILEFDGDLANSKKGKEKEKEKEKESKRSKTPNYMKPTTSSHSRTTDEIKNKGVPSSRPHSSSSHSSGPNPNPNPHHSKTLMKRLSMKLTRPWMKKPPSVTENPVPGRATCSSTLKDSKFPKKLETSEPDGFSTVKVCPYNHCSLNGQHHNTTPPLTRVISLRRRMLRGQKGVRLKAFSSFKLKGIRKSRDGDSRELVISRAPSMRAPLIEEVTDDDYFIEIYASNDEPYVTELDEFEECDAILNALGELRIEGNDSVGEFESEVSFEDELSTAQMNVVEDFLEYIDDGGGAEDNSRDDLVLISPDFDAEWYLNCHEADAIGKDSDNFAENIANCCTNYEELCIYDDLCECLDGDPDKHVSPLVINEETASFPGLHVACAFAQSDYSHDSEEERPSRVPANTSPKDLMNQLICDIDTHHELFPSRSSFDFEEEQLNIEALPEFYEIASADASSEDSSNLITCGLDVPPPELLLSDFSSDAEELLEDLSCFFSDSGKERMKIDARFGFEGKVSVIALPVDLVNEPTDVSNSNSLGNETCGTICGVIDTHVGHLALNEDASLEDLCNVAPGALFSCDSSVDSDAECLRIDVQPEFDEIAPANVSSEYSKNSHTGELAVPLPTTVPTHSISDDASEFKKTAQDLPNKHTDALSFNSESVSANVTLDDLENEFIDDTSLDTEIADIKKESSDDTSDIIDGCHIGNFIGEDMLISGECTNGRDDIHHGVEEFVEHDDGTSTMMIQFSHCPQGFHEINLELMDIIDENQPHDESSTISSSSMSKAIGRYIRRRSTEGLPELSGFNLRGPNFLPEIQDPEAEKVDLKHQETDARKNSEEWMVDYALQRTVSRLARARSRKVRLFVEAFETVMQPCGS